MTRREFLTRVGGVGAWPLTARAQQREPMGRVGVLEGFAESNREGQERAAAFREGLKQLGWIEGRNIRIDILWAGPGDAELIRRLARELVALQPNLILSSSTPTTAALLNETRTIPIVFANISDPLGNGFVASFPARAATSPASPTWNPPWPVNGLSC
jgi:putative ABC transport system substrate-binding protein